jgi:hypothetical protein
VITEEKPNGAVAWRVCAALYQSLGGVQQCQWAALHAVGDDDQYLKQVKEALTELEHRLVLSRGELK